MKEKPGFNFEKAISHLLRFGVMASFALLLTGMVLILFHGSHGRALVNAGLLLLIFTPIARVAVSVFVFTREGDRIFSLITAFVLCVLLASFLFGAMA